MRYSEIWTEDVHQLDIQGISVGISRLNFVRWNEPKLPKQRIRFLAEITSLLLLLLVRANQYSYSNVWNSDNSNMGEPA
jgi:hypothetical protein